MKTQLVTTIENFMQVAAHLLDNAQRQILVAMLSDQASKLGISKKRLPFSLGPKRASVSSENSNTSETSHVNS